MSKIKNDSALENLVIASLLSEGELNTFTTHEDDSVLIVPFSSEKAIYLFNYLKTNQLLELVYVQPEKGQFKITLSPELTKFVKDWYENGKKVFKKRIGIEGMTYESIVICINLFGVRKLEGLSINTSIDYSYLKTVAYCMKLILQLEVIIGKNQLKLPDVPDLLLQNMDKLSTIDSSELANFLTKQEKNRLIAMKGVIQYG